LPHVLLWQVVVSVIASYISNRKILKNELLKINSSIEQNYTSQLIEQRAKYYPEVHFLISQFARDLEMMEKGYNFRAPITKLTLVYFKNKFELLDSKNALFFSIATGYKCAELRSELYSSIALLKNDTDLLVHSQVDVLRTKISHLETALKKDLGIMIDEFQYMRNKYSGDDYENFKK
jgi:hypothetical protein